MGDVIMTQGTSYIMGHCEECHEPLHVVDGKVVNTTVLSMRNGVPTLTAHKEDCSILEEVRRAE